MNVEPIFYLCYAYKLCFCKLSKMKYYGQFPEENLFFRLLYTVCIWFSWLWSCFLCEDRFYIKFYLILFSLTILNIPTCELFFLSTKLVYFLLEFCKEIIQRKLKEKNPILKVITKKLVTTVSLVIDKASIYDSI